MRSRPTNATPSPQATPAFGAVVDASERPELSAGADVPDAHRAVGAERREPRAVRAEPGREDAAAMRTQDVNRVAGGGIPEPRGAVGASGCDEPAVRGCTRPRTPRPVCPASVTSFLPVPHRECSPSRPSRSAATKRDPSGARATTCPMPVLRPMPGTVDSTREVASASWRACSASVSMVPSCRRVVSAASIASRMLRSGSTSRFACADAASWRAVARRASSRASLRRTSANAASTEAAAASTANPASVARRRRARRRAAAFAAARASARNSRSPAVRARSVAPAQASNCASRPSRGRYSGSRPASCHSATASTSRRWRRRSSRRSSIHPRSRSHWDRIASCATSTVGVRVSGSRSKVSSRCSP